MPNGSELLLALAIPVAILSILRINAALVFLSLCLGQVLVETVARDADSLLRLAAPHASPAGSSTMQLVVLCAPPILTAVIMVFTIHGRLRTIANIIPAIATAALTILLVVPLLTPGVQQSIHSAGLWHQFSNAESLVVGIGAAVSLIFLWSQRRSAKHAEQKHSR